MLRENQKKTQVYAVVHDGASFLLAIKNRDGYFFQDADEPDGGAIVPNGRRLNGGGNFALPGGGLDGHEPAEGAWHEFLQETGIDLTPYGGQLNPPPVRTDHDEERDYWGVFFHVSPDAFQAIGQHADRNLDAGTAASNAVRAGIYGRGEYGDLRRAFPESPADDELDSISSWNLESRWEEIQQWERTRDLSWYYHILKYWREQA